MSLAIGLAVLVVYAYPGYMSSDSAVQLTDARRHVHGDVHPPMMAVLWRLVELVVTGPVGMLVLQGSLFVVGTYWILRRHLGDRSAAVAASAACAQGLQPGAVWSFMNGMALAEHSAPEDAA